MVLDVYLAGRLSGVLESGRNGISYTYADVSSLPLSPSLEVRDESWNVRKVLPFFSNLLPDGWERRLLADALNLREGQTLPLLRAVCRDAAGAVTILPHGGSYQENADYTEVTEEMIAEKIRRRNEESFLLWNRSAHVTISGAQSKMCFFRSNGKWYLPKGNSPTNTIVKPHEEYAENEVIVTKLASLCLLSVPEVELVSFDGEKALASSRYDRKDGRRLHQVDMCQTAGILPGNKYECDGGPGVRDVSDMIARYSSSPGEDLKEFRRMLVFNFLSGNADAHAKNFSLLYSEDMSSIRLAPFYDNVSTAVYPYFDRNLSMKIGKRRNMDAISREDFLAVEGIDGAFIDEMSDDYLSALRKMEDEYGGNDLFGKIKEQSLIRLERLRV